MGLDMYVYLVKKKNGMSEIYPSRDRSGDFDDIEKMDQEFQYWRKHYALNHWMYELAKGEGFDGCYEAFNCIAVRLTEQDIKNLQHAVEHGGVKAFESEKDPYTEDQAYQDYRFCERALKTLKTKTVALYYLPWR